MGFNWLGAGGGLRPRALPGLRDCGVARGFAGGRVADFDSVHPKLEYYLGNSPAAKSAFQRPLQHGRPALLERIHQRRPIYAEHYSPAGHARDPTVAPELSVDQG